MSFRSSRIAICSVALTLLVTCASSAQQSDNAASSGQMGTTEYAKLLSRLEVSLSSWESTLQKVDPGAGDVPYSVGKLIETNQKVALLQISNLRVMIRGEKQARTAYGELALGVFLSELATDSYALSLQGALNHLSVDMVGQFAAEIGSFQKRFTEDGLARVRAMEAGGCHPAL